MAALSEPGRMFAPAAGIGPWRACPTGPAAQAYTRWLGTAAVRWLPFVAAGGAKNAQVLGGCLLPVATPIGRGRPTHGPRIWRPNRPASSGCTRRSRCSWPHDESISVGTPNLKFLPPRPYMNRGEGRFLWIGPPWPATQRQAFPRSEPVSSLYQWSSTMIPLIAVTSAIQHDTIRSPPEGECGVGKHLSSAGAAQPAKGARPPLSPNSLRPRSCSRAWHRRQTGLSETASAAALSSAAGIRPGTDAGPAVAGMQTAHRLINRLGVTALGIGPGRDSRPWRIAWPCCCSGLGGCEGTSVVASAITRPGRHREVSGPPSCRTANIFRIIAGRKLTADRHEPPTCSAANTDTRSTGEDRLLGITAETVRLTTKRWRR